MLLDNYVAGNPLEIINELSEIVCYESTDAMPGNTCLEVFGKPAYGIYANLYDIREYFFRTHVAKKHISPVYPGVPMFTRVDKVPGLVSVLLSGERSFTLRAYGNKTSQPIMDITVVAREPKS